LILSQGIFTIVILLITIGICLTSLDIPIEEKGIKAGGVSLVAIFIADGLINFAGASLENDKRLEDFFTVLLSFSGAVLTFVATVGLIAGWNFAFLFGITKGYAVAVVSVGFVLSSAGLSFYAIPATPLTVLFKERKNEIASTILTVLITSAILYWVPKFI